MRQDRDEQKMNSWGKPSLRLISPSLKLVHDVCWVETTAFQFNRHYPGFPVFLSDEYIVATFPVAWDL